MLLLPHPESTAISGLSDPLPLYSVIYSFFSRRTTASFPFLGYHEICYTSHCVCIPFFVCFGYIPRCILLGCTESFLGSVKLLPCIWHFVCVESEDFEDGHSPLPPWVPGFKFRLSGLCSKCFYPLSHFSSCLSVLLNPRIEPGASCLPGRASQL